MTQQEVIKAFIKSLDDTDLSGRAALDDAVRACSNFGSYQALVDQFKADVQASGGNWQRFLIEKCGIIINNEDSGAITGSDAGGSEVRTTFDILPVEGDAVYPEGSEFTVNGLTIYGIPDRSTLTEQEQLVVQGLYSWWIKESLDLIEETYGLTLDEDGVTNHRMKLDLFYDPTIIGLAAVDPEVTDDGMTSEVATLRINMAMFEDITEDNAHGYISSLRDSLDRTIVHELTHALMMVNFNYVDDLPHWFTEGSAELIAGIDQVRSTEFSNFLVNETDQLFDMLSTNAIGSNYPYIVYTGGVIFLRYLAKQAGDQTFDYDTYRENVTVDGGSAINYFSEVSVSGGANADTIFNTGYNATVNAGAGDDSILNYYEAIINGDAGVDTIRNYGDGATLNGGAGDDIIVNGGVSDANEGSGALLNGNEGDDVITNHASNVTIDGGAGNDQINVDVSNSSVNGGDGNDRINSNGENATVNGGAGDDTITQSASLGVVFGDEGNDYISVIETRNTINGGAGNDTLINIDSGNYNHLYGGDGDDLIENRAEEITIVGGDGNDLIRNLGQKVSLEAGAGNDTIVHEGFVATIDAGDGNDLIQASGDYATLTGGAGNDTFMISDGMGVVVSDFNSVEDVISIASGGSSLRNADGSITINFANAVVTVDNSNDSAQVSVIKRFMASLDQTELSGRAAFDEAVRASSDFTSYAQLVEQFRADFKSCNGNWNKFLQQYCGIKLHNKDTGAITGSDAGGSTVKTNATIVDLGEYSEDDPYPEGSEFTVDGLTVYGIPDRDELTDDQQVIVKNLYNHWLKGGLDLIKQSYGLSYNEEGTTNHRLCLRFMDEEDGGMLAAVVANSTGDDFKECGGAQLVINMAYFEDADAEDLTAENIHRTIAHELVHGVMASNFNYYGDLPNWFVEGAAELVHGIDDDRISEFPIMFTDESIAEQIVELEFSGTDQPYPIYTAGYTFLRYFAHQAAGDQTVASEDNYISNYVDGETITPSDSGTMIENAGDYVLINFDGKTGNVHNYGRGSTIEGSGNFSAITNHAEYVYIEGSDVVDFITNNAADATINVDAGNDAITNYGARSLIDAGDGNDAIENNARLRTWASFDENENGRLTFTVHSDLQSGADSTIDGGNGNDKITNQSDRAYINGGSGNDTLQNVSVTLNSMMSDDDPSIHAGVDATLDGGAGNDIIINTPASAWLIGNNGDDSIYNGGNEVWIEGDDGEDAIINSGDRASIDGGSGDDLIRNAGAHATIDGDLGDDTIINEGRLVSIDGGDGNDLIRSSGDHATLIGGAGADTFVVTDGAGVVIADYNSLEDMISIASGVEGVTTINSTVESEYEYITVDGSFTNVDSDTMIVGGSNADSIINNGYIIEMYGGGSNDTVINEGYIVAINAGAGDDYILNRGDRAVLIGGGGKDTFVIADGFAVTLPDFDPDEDIISLASGAETLINDEGMLEVTIQNPVEPVDSTAYSSQAGVIKTIMSSLDQTTLTGNDALEEAVSVASGGAFETWQAFVDNFTHDLISCGDNWYKFLIKYCGINLHNADTGAILGADAGGTLMSADNVIDQSAAASYPSGSSFTVDGLTIYGIPERDDLTADQQSIVEGLYSWWVNGSLDLINRSYGLTFNEEGSRNHRLLLQFKDEPYSTYIAAVGGFEFSEGEYDGAFFNINMANIHQFDVERTIAHELTHAAMYTNFSNLYQLPLWFVEGSAELVPGADDQRRETIIEYVQRGYPLINMLNGVEYDDPLTQLANSSLDYSGGYVALRYMAKQFSGETFDYDEYRSKITGNDQVNYFDDVKMIGSSKADTIVNAGSEVLINAKGGADVIANSGSDVTIKSGAGDDFVYNYSGEVMIDLGTGDDSIRNMSSNVTIKMGAGDDSILSVGKDVTIVSGSGHDTIKITAGSAWIKDYSARNDTLILVDGASTLESNGGILVTFDATSDQLSAMIEIDEPTDELSDLMTPTAIESGIDDHAFDHQLFDRDQILSTALSQRKRHNIKD